MSVPNTTLDRNMPILVVDDLPMMRRVVKNCLNQLGFENIKEASDSVAALAQLQNEPFKLVISDWSIPAPDGLGLIQSVRECRALKDLPVLFVIPETQNKEVTKVPETESHADFIVKPFTSQLLQEKIEELLVQGS